MNKKQIIATFFSFIFWASALLFVLSNDGSENNQNDSIKSTIVIDTEEQIAYSGHTDNLKLLSDNKIPDFQDKLKESREVVAERERLIKAKLEEEKRIAEEKRLAAEKAEAERIAEEARQVELARIAEEKRLADLEAQRVAKNKEKEEAKKNGTEKVVVSRGEQSNQNWIAFEATHYTAFCDTGCIGVTALGFDVSNTIYYDGLRIIAVDPNIIPLGSIVEVRASYGSFMAIAGDTGGVIKGQIVDILVGSIEEANSLGRITVSIRIIK